MVRTDNLVGNGAYFKIDYYNQSSQLIQGASKTTGIIVGTTDEFTKLCCVADAPMSAKFARVQAIVEGNGVVYLDSIKLTQKQSNVYIYDTAGNYLLNSKDAFGVQDYSIYDSIGNELTYRDRENNTTSFNYDNLNRLKDITLPYGHAYYDYDPLDNLIGTHGLKSSGPSDTSYLTSYGFNNINQPSNVTFPTNPSSGISYTYDRSGNLTRITYSPSNKYINFSYDNANRLTNKTYDDGKYYNYTYDAADNLTGITDQAGNSYSFSYDYANRVTRFRDNTKNYEINYSWDKSYNLTNEYIDDNDYFATYNYGMANRLNSVTFTLPDGIYDNYI
ncbi:MAG: YD repeat protein [Desulfotomaculum sp. 46_296]|nr:MAG: YD repeat protein [Desulfotomaculum sp. 46_296]